MSEIEYWDEHSFGIVYESCKVSIWSFQHIRRPYYGEIPYVGRIIKAGFEAGVVKRKYL